MSQLEEAWNHNMVQHFFPSWINVIDDSMMEWFNKWDRGFMCVVCKPHPFVNKRHTICCALTSIMWRAQILEGKYKPTQLSPKKWEEMGKTVGLMLRMCETIFSTGKCVVLESGFCVSKGITYLLEFGIYMLLHSPRSANTGPRVYQEMPLTNTYWKRCYLCGYIGGHK